MEPEFDGVVVEEGEEGSEDAEGVPTAPPPLLGLFPFPFPLPGVLFGGFDTPLPGLLELPLPGLPEVGLAGELDDEGP